MYLLTMLVLLACGGWLTVNTHRRLRNGGFGVKWFVWYLILLVAGVSLGIYLLTTRHLVSPTRRAYGFPFPIAGGDFINGRWLDGGVGRYFPLAALTDVTCGIAVGVLPVAVLSFLRQRRQGPERENSHVA